MTATISERDHRNIVELIADEGEQAYDDIRNWHPTAPAVKVAALVEEVRVILMDALEIEDAPTGDRFMTSDELAREHRWLADDLVAAFLKTVS